MGRDLGLETRRPRSGTIDLTGARPAASWLREQLYNRRDLKQVPPLVLNASAEAQQAFLAGYYAGDGLKRGNGASIKTNSAVLAQGLCWMYHVAGQPASVYVEQRAGKTYYQLNLASAVARRRQGPAPAQEPGRGHATSLPACVPDDEWTFDLETESGRFCAGVGRLVISNSPRRGLEFVTRKITWHAAAIKHGLREGAAPRQPRRRTRLGLRARTTWRRCG